MGLRGLVLLQLAAHASASKDDTQYIVGGTELTPYKYPFLISLRGSYGSHSCAAHCRTAFRVSPALTHRCRRAGVAEPDLTHPLPHVLGPLRRCGCSRVAPRWVLTVSTHSSSRRCGGSLIDPRWVLTAAHCITAGASPASYSVMIHGHSLAPSSAAGSVCTEVLGLVRVVCHPGYDKDTMGSDVCLLQLAQDAKCGDGEP